MHYPQTAYSVMRIILRVSHGVMRCVPILQTYCTETQCQQQPRRIYSLTPLAPLRLLATIQATVPPTVLASGHASARCCLTYSTDEMSCRRCPRRKPSRHHAPSASGAYDIVARSEQRSLITTLLRHGHSGLKQMGTSAIQYQLDSWNIAASVSLVGTCHYSHRFCEVWL